MDMTDFYVLASNYGKGSSSTGFNRLADFNNDGAVDMSDFYVLVSNYGKFGTTRPAVASTMSYVSKNGYINEASEKLSGNESSEKDSEGGCNAGIAILAVLALVALPFFRKR